MYAHALKQVLSWQAMFPFCDNYILFLEGGLKHPLILPIASMYLPYKNLSSTYCICQILLSAENIAGERETQTINNSTVLIELVF